MNCNSVLTNGLALVNDHLAHLIRQEIHEVTLLLRFCHGEHFLLQLSKLRVNQMIQNTNLLSLQCIKERRVVTHLDQHVLESREMGKETSLRVLIVLMAFRTYCSHFCEEENIVKNAILYISRIQHLQ